MASSESMAACAGRPSWKAISMFCPSRSEELRRICLRPSHLDRCLG